MKYLIAVDGGGTKTEAVLAGCYGNVLATAITTGSNRSLSEMRKLSGCGRFRRDNSRRYRS